MLSELVCDDVAVGAGVTVADSVAERLPVRVAVEVGAGVIVLDLVSVSDTEAPDSVGVEEVDGVGGGVIVRVRLRL